MLSFDPIEEARRNWMRHGWGDGTAMVAATSLTRAHQILLARINEALSPHGLSFSRFEVLALLYFSKERALPLGKIGSRLQVHPRSSLFRPPKSSTRSSGCRLTPVDRRFRLR